MPTKGRRLLRGCRHLVSPCSQGYGYLVTDDVTPQHPRILTIAQVADELAVGLPTVRQLLMTGELRGIQAGGRGLWRVAAKDLEDCIEQAYRVTAERVTQGELSGDAVDD